MALKINNLFPSRLLPHSPKSQTRTTFFPSASTTTPKFQIHCTTSHSRGANDDDVSKLYLTDAELASELAAEVGKMTSQMVRREEAMRKSRELLFNELCRHAGLKSLTAKNKWRNMNEFDKLVFAKNFISEWRANLHPLSARSVKEMVDEYLVEDNPTPNSATPSLFPAGLMKIMGFSSNN